MKSDSHRDESRLTPPVSEHPDRQPANISHGDMQYHHHVHPSQERAFNRAEAPVPVTHHNTEPADDAAARHRERLRHHAEKR
jgi:hypothetical protein